MKRINTYIISILIILQSASGYAQPQKQNRLDRIHAIKVGFITDQLKLTPGQSEKFWPVYNQYEHDIRAVRHNFIEKYRAQNTTSNEQEARKYIHDNLDYQEEVLQVKKKYQAELLKIISAQQLAQLYQSEREFKKILLERLKNHREKTAATDNATH